MGWTYFAKPEGPGAVVKELQRNLTWESDTAKYTFLRGAFVGLTYYAAVECLKKVDGKRHVFAAVDLVRYQHRGDEREMCVKEMGEDMGPCESRCPKTILDLLTPLESGAGYAQEWRDRCRKYHALKAAPITAEELTAWAAKHGRDFATLSPDTQKRWKTVYRNRRAAGHVQA